VEEAVKIAQDIGKEDGVPSNSLKDVRTGDVIVML